MKVSIFHIIGAAVLVWALVGCSFQVEFGYHGETGRDNRTYTGDVKKAQQDKRY